MAAIVFVRRVSFAGLMMSRGCREKVLFILVIRVVRIAGAIWVAGSCQSETGRHSEFIVLTAIMVGVVSLLQDSFSVFMLSHSLLQMLRMALIL